MNCFFRVPLPLIIVAVVAGGKVHAADGSKLKFNRDIRPILSDNCFRCHGFDKNKREADLRLDTAAGAFAERDGGVKPIVPGKPEESELIRRITTDNPDERMPPAETHQVITPAQVATLKQWITEGAEYESHWAFITPVEPSVPEFRIVNSEYRVHNPIDTFIIARLMQAGLTMSPEADKATLLRRVTLDLTGLPPTLAETDAFIADTSPDAYEKVVERLLASPRYGERMVLEWLDAARYADTNGYQGDLTRTMWPWRDWVIRAMNANMPFNQFTVEQLAGDLLPNATVEQKVATGFNRNHPLNGEGGRIPEESRVDYVMDRVETTSTVWLGLTVGCCRCHDHKYDPLLQKEYFQIFSYFNNVDETGAVDARGNANPIIKAMMPADEARLAELKVKFAEAEANYNAVLPAINEAQAKWEAAAGKSSLEQWENWSLPEIARLKTGAKSKNLADKSILFSGRNVDNDTHLIVLRTDATKLTALRLEAMRDEKLPNGGPGRAPNGNFVLTNIEAVARSVADPTRTQRIVFRSATADYAQGGFPIEDAFDDDLTTGWAVEGAPTNDRVAVFSFAEPVGFEGGTEIELKLAYESEHAQHVMGRCRFAVTDEKTPKLSMLPAKIAAILAKPQDQRNAKERRELTTYYHRAVEMHPAQTAINKARAELESFEKMIPMTMVMQDHPTPREAFILDKGNYQKPGEKVQPGVIAAIYPSDREMPKTRLDFAQWLVDPANPLTARVTVNRYWQTFFGVGIVKTSEDFGVQSEAPSHRELLDWLAVRFVKSGWDVKAMHRLIVTSAAYRQSSRTSPDLLERDPENRLLARGPRIRMPAYVIRDQALAISGLLVEKLGGPPVKPYMAAGVWEDASTGKIKYKRDTGEGLYRRSVYTFWRRIAAPAMLFDISPRSVCSVRLPRTNTPLQALILMNDVQYVEAARNLATLVMKEADDPAERLSSAFRRCTSRYPTKDEQAVLASAYEQMQARFQSDRSAAAKLVSQGDSPRPQDVDVAELASYTSVASLILNLDETITKE